MSHYVIAIDGPAASGKSSVAKVLADRLGLVYVNSGAMYRAMAWAALERGIDPGDAAGVCDMMGRIAIDCGREGSASTIAVDGYNPAAHLTEDRVNASVSAIASIPEVRERLVAEQRAYLEHSDIVMEGRDIGSVVFPDTPFKFYLSARPEVRSGRRRAQGQDDAIEERDRQDSTRASSPLVIPEGATVIDTSELDIDGVAEAIVAKLREGGIAG